MGFTVEQECPQCGAPIELDETDRLLKCPYCDVNNFLFTPDYFRYVLPNKAPDRELIYAPYLRFKGNVYFCRGMSIGHRIVDITHVGVDMKGLPVSLGLRPQAMKMKFVTPESGAVFLRFTFKASDILMRAGKISSGPSKDQLLHRAFIGETMSLIYLPMYIKDGRLFDAVINKPVTGLSQGIDSTEGLSIKSRPWKIHFIPILCPQCGWNLEGERDSVVMLCRNCTTAWEAKDGKFTQIKFSTMPEYDQEVTYLPFWRITVNSTGVDINSFADFLRLTNQPRVIRAKMEEEEMSFWSPAFKIRPKLFLSLARNFTIAPKNLKTEEIIPRKGLFPITLPRTEAVQALKVILASAAVNKKNIFPNLPHINFQVKDSNLVYLPFVETAGDMVQQDIKISVNKKSLEYGRRL